MNLGSKIVNDKCIYCLGSKTFPDTAIDKVEWNYYYNMAYKHACRGVFNNLLAITVAQQQAYDAGHYAGHKEWRMKNLLKG